MSRRGALIVFEGVDRCGKTTQTRRLVDFLRQRGERVELLRFPDRTTSTGKIIDEYLRNGVELDDRAIHLLFSANRWEAADNIRHQLAEGTTLVVDRYSYSGICFTAAKPGQKVSWCAQPENGLPEPDAVIFLDLPIDQAMLRGNFGEERYEKEEFQRRVYANFLQLKSPQWRVLDAARTVEELESEVQGIALDTIRACNGQPVGSLNFGDMAFPERG